MLPCYDPHTPFRFLADISTMRHACPFPIQIKHLILFRLLKSNHLQETHSANVRAIIVFSLLFLGAVFVFTTYQVFCFWLRSWFLRGKKQRKIESRRHSIDVVVCTRFIRVRFVRLFIIPVGRGEWRPASPISHQLPEYIFFSTDAKLLLLSLGTAQELN